MSESYLVAHLVRGQPAFDIAERIECAVCEGTEVRQVGLHTGEPCNCDNGHWWMIHGQRAYPYWSGPLSHAGFWPNDDDPDATLLHVLVPPTPPNHPDFYSANDRLRHKALDEIVAEGSAAKGQGKLTGLAEMLGLTKKAEPVRRRV